MALALCCVLGATGLLIRRLTVISQIASPSPRSLGWLSTGRSRTHIFI